MRSPQRRNSAAEQIGLRIRQIFQLCLLFVAIEQSACQTAQLCVMLLIGTGRTLLAGIIIAFAQSPRMTVRCQQPEPDGSRVVGTVVDGDIQFPVRSGGLPDVSCFVKHCIDNALRHDPFAADEPVIYYDPQV